MKIKKSKFAKLLTLVLPIAAISIVTPVVLTSCGSSNSTTTPDKPDNGGSGGGSDTGGGGTSGGGTSGGDTGGSGSETPSVVTASWDNSKLNNITGVAYNSDNKTVTITLDSSSFNDTGLTKTSTLDAIKKSLTPLVESSSLTKSSIITKDEEQPSPTKTLYSLLSPAITNVDKFDVSVNINPNDVIFDYTNDNVANTINGQFVLTPKTQTKDANSQNKQTLSFTIQNFNDSYNGESGKQLTWNNEKIKTALNSATQGSGNKLPELDATISGANAIIKLPSTVTLTQVMYELSNTSISSSELKDFFTGDTSSFNLDNATISGWALSVDHSKMFTRIVIPSATSGGQEAILYIVYTGYDYKTISGSPIWNRNIPYFDAKDENNDLWDIKYKEPVIDLTNNNIKFNDVDLSKDSSATQIKSKASEIAQYVAQEYLLGYSNFDIDTAKIDSSTGKFDENGLFSASVSKETKDSENSSILKNNDNVIQIRILLKAKNGFKTPTNDNEYNYNLKDTGFWKAFYIVGYKTTNQ